MKAQIRKLAAMGYDTAIKTWASEYEERGFYIMAWKPKQVKETTVSAYTHKVTEGLRLLIRIIKEREAQPK